MERTTLFSVSLGGLRRLACLATLLIAAPGFTATALAATWYVRPKAPLGTYGSENGKSYETAFNGLTIAGRDRGGLVWGNGGIQAGDTLFISGNHWHQISQTSQNFFHGRIAIPVQGESDDKPITIRCDAPEEPGILWGYGRNTSLSDQWTGPDANGVYAINRDLGSFIAQDITAGQNGRVYLNEKTTATWVGEPGSFARLNGKTYVKTTDGGSPAGRLYVGNISYRFALLRNQYITFKNCNFYGFLMDVDRDEGGELVPDLPRSNHITFEGCKILYGDEQDFFRLYDGNNYWRFYNCLFEYATGGVNSFGTFGGEGASFMHIRGCTFRNMGMLMFPHQDAHGIGLRRGHDNLIEHNTFENTGSAIEFWTSVGNPMRDMTVRYNFIKNIAFRARSEGGGIVISGDNPTTGTSIIGERTGFKIYGNIIINADGAGVSSNNQDVVTVSNNVIYNCGTGLRFEVYGGLPVRAVVKNNIIANPRQFFLIVAGIGNQLDWDHNVYWSNAANSSLLWKPYYSFAGWRVETGSDVHGIESNPKFVAANPDSPQGFHLQSNSVAIDAGENVSLAFDYDGTKVPLRNGPDIGAFEFVFQNAVPTSWLDYQ